MDLFKKYISLMKKAMDFEADNMDFYTKGGGKCKSFHRLRF